MPAPLPASPPAAALPPARAFGRLPADLDLDFASRDRCTLATRVIARCCAAADDLGTHEALAWDLPLGARIARLLRIVQLTTDADAVAVALTCPRPPCRQAFEVALPLGAMIDGRPEAGAATRTVRVGDTGLQVRLPTGSDQRAWRSRSYPNADDAALALATRLVLTVGATEPSGRGAPLTEPDTARAEAARLRPSDLPAIAAALEAADPLVAFTVRTTCPHCDEDAEIAVDLEQAALGELARARRALLRTVHTLASHYHWSEAEVLALPPPRRAEYLRLIDAANDLLP